MVHTLTQTHSKQTHFASARHTELAALIWALELHPYLALNIFSDSCYLYTVSSTIETAVIGHTSNEELFHLFCQLQKLVQARPKPSYIGHIWAHSRLPRPLTLGNDIADQTTHPQAYTLLAAQVSQSTPITQAQLSDTTCHQNTAALWRQFGITKKEAQHIVKTCSTCQIHLPIPCYRINPRGLLPNQLWQMDVTHFPSFRNIPYVHVVIDACSRFLFATTRPGGATHVISIVSKHFQ